MSTDTTTRQQAAETRTLSTFLKWGKIAIGIFAGGLMAHAYAGDILDEKIAIALQLRPEHAVTSKDVQTVNTKIEALSARHSDDMQSMRLEGRSNHIAITARLDAIAAHQIPAARYRRAIEIVDEHAARIRRMSDARDLIDEADRERAIDEERDDRGDP